jgi:RNA methyltransferase, TrmH family
MMTVITSPANKTYKLLKKLMLKKHRDTHGLFLVYGPHLVAKAQASGVVLETITTTEGDGSLGLEPTLFMALQQTETPYDVMALCEKRSTSLVSKRILILDDVQDPDNVGALIRSASAFGFLHVILSNKTADLYNEKTIRASKGAIFDVFVERRQALEAATMLKTQGYQIIASASGGDQVSRFSPPLVLIMGNEGHGIHQALMDVADGVVGIETKRVESLNVAVAGSLLMYEWRSL